MIKNQVYGRRQVRPLRVHRRHLMETLLPTYRLTLETPYNPSTAPLWIEIGFGSGEHLATLAHQHPHTQFIGCEPFVNGVASLLQHIERLQLTNIKIFPGNAHDLLAWLPEQSAERVYLLFPDPWPKKRHHKRRFIQKETLHSFARVLTPAGQLTIATDHVGYLDWIQEILSQQNDFKATRVSIYERPSEWIASRYEEKAIAAGRQPGYLLLSKFSIN